MRHDGKRVDRRTMLRATAVSLPAIGLAGCTGPGDDEDDSEEDGDSEGSSAEDDEADEQQQP